MRRDKQVCLCEFIFSKLIKKSCDSFKINEYAEKNPYLSKNTGVKLIRLWH